MATTLLQLRTETLDILNDLETSAIYSTDFINQTLNDQQVEVCDGQKYSFLRSKKLFLYAEDTTTTAAVDTADTTISLSNVDNFEASGAIWIDHDVIPYTAISTLDLTGVTGITIDHVSGDKVYPLIALPTNYGHTPELLWRAAGSSFYKTVPYVNEVQWDQDGVGAYKSKKFTIVESEETAGTKYLRLDGFTSGDTMVFYYVKSPTTMSDDADTATIPDPYALKILPKLAAYKAMYFRGDNVDGLGDVIRNEAERELLKMRKHFGRRDEGLSSMVQNKYQSGVYNSRSIKRVRI